VSTSHARSLTGLNWSSQHLCRFKMQVPQARASWGSRASSPLTT
jgi:hypothetical protein